MVRDTYLASQPRGMLSPWFVALIAMMTLVAVALLVALVVTSGIGPHVAHVAPVAQSLAHQGLAAIFRDLCSGSASTSC